MRAELEEASRIVAPLWPLGTFIAVNPLWDLRHLGFETAIEVARRRLSIGGYPSPRLFGDAWRSGRITSADLDLALRAVEEAEASAGGPLGSVARLELRGEEPDRPHGLVAADVEAINREVSKWCAAFVAGLMPSADHGFYRAWLSSVGRDPGAARLLGRSGRARLTQLPAVPEDAITACLDRLGRPLEEWAVEFARQLAALPGWAGHAKWRSRWAPPGQSGPALHLVDYVAVRLAYHAEMHASPSRPRRWRAERTTVRLPRLEGSGGESQLAAMETLHGQLPPAIGRALSSLPSDQAAHVWLSAYEGHYRDQLLGRLTRPASRENSVCAAQLVFCIDARSEGLRRHLEALGPYESFGFAGFFALPLRYRALGAEPVDLCPVLVNPTVEMIERPFDGAAADAARRLRGEQSIGRSAHALSAIREGSVSPFVSAEAGGLFAAPLLVAKTIGAVRYRQLRNWAVGQIAPPARTTVAAEPDRTAMSDEEQALFAETALFTMGLTRNFAPLVVLCGHGSTTENNPHATALDCGACGGNRGGVSARAVAGIFNRPVIRALLAERGLSIPDDTWFLAAEHDTATDRVVLFDRELAPDAHQPAIDRLSDDLARAGEELAAERCRDLPGGTERAPVAEVTARSADWAEVQPEWGLARNAAFVVGPRSMTAGVDLERRAFLHSYDAEVDPEGTAIETILTAPMVVAHWINAQYYFSTVDPAVYSAGDKTVHNVVGGIGVTEGPSGDLKTGLPLQSLFDGDRVYHEPLRLLTVIQAPLRRLDAVIGRNPVLQELFNGQWVHLAARENEHAPWQIRQRDGSWRPWVPAGAVGELEPREQRSDIQPSRSKEECCG